MEETPENSKESSHSAYANGMNQYQAVGSNFSLTKIILHFQDLYIYGNYLLLLMYKQLSFILT
jgi:hypothetical protein